MSCQCPKCQAIGARAPMVEYRSFGRSLVAESVSYPRGEYHYLQVTSRGAALDYVPATLPDYPRRTVLASRVVVNPLESGTAPAFVPVPRTRAERRRAAFLRGTESLSAEQCDRYGRRMARLERLGPWSLAVADVERIKRTAEQPDRDLREVHAVMYPAAYVADDTAPTGDAYRAMSRRTSTGALPTYGVDRPNIAERERRYDIDDRVARDIEREADRILHADYDARVAAGEADVPVLHGGLDVIDRWTLFPEVAPDSVAYRGAAHYKAPAIHASERRHSVKRTHRFFIASTTDISRVSLYFTRITRADGTQVVYRGCVGVGYYGRKILVRKRNTGEPTGRRKPTVWGIKATSVRQRWSVLLKGGTETRPVAPEVVDAMVKAERAALLALVKEGRVTIQGATLDMSADRSTNGRGRVIVRGCEDTTPTMVDETGVAVRRALLATLA